MTKDIRHIHILCRECKEILDIKSEGFDGINQIAISIPVHRCKKEFTYHHADRSKRCEVSRDEFFSGRTSPFSDVNCKECLEEAESK